MYLAGAIAMVFVAGPYFALLGPGEYWKIIAALVLANSVTFGNVEGAQPAFISEMLPVHLRFSGLGIGLKVSSVLGGVSPVIATALLAHYRSAVPVAWIDLALGQVPGLKKGCVSRALFAHEYVRVARAGHPAA